MPIEDDTREFVPGRVFREDDETTKYWLRNDMVMFRHYPVKGADPSTFRFYLGNFAKDRYHCYSLNSRLAGGDSYAFRALNFTYATDGICVWTLGGKVKGVDAKSFQVCDDGVRDLGVGGLRTPYGYGKDKDRVFFYDLNGATGWVRQASIRSFVSLNDGYFGKDDKHVFCYAAILPEAKVPHWKKIGGYYSKDDSRIYFVNRVIKEADYSTFEVVSAIGTQIARDKNHYYCNSAIVAEAELVKLLQRETIARAPAGPFGWIRALKDTLRGPGR